MILRILGCLLLVAAGLKLHGLAIESVGRAGIFSEPWLQTAIVEWEIILGLWLIWGKQRSVAWLAAGATFVVFAGVSFWQGWIGQVTCGCLGSIIQINPWLAFAIDGIVLMMLAQARRRAFATESARPIASALRPIMFGAGGVLVILGLFAAIGTLAFGSPAAALGYLRGERLSVEPRLVDVGEGYIGEQKQVVVQLRNWTDKRIRVVGGTADCSCLVTGELPVTVEPGERCPLTVMVWMKGPPGQFTRSVNLLTHDEHFRIISFRLTGQSYPLSPEQASRDDK